jgi:hypothetical protein
VDFPSFLRHGLLGVRLRGEGGAITDEVVRMRSGTLEPLWSSRETVPVGFRYDGGAAPDVVTIRDTNGTGGERLVRISDGAELFVADPCPVAGANHDLVLTLCTTQTLVGNRYLQYAPPTGGPARFGAHRDGH